MNFWHSFRWFYNLSSPSRNFLKLPIYFLFVSISATVLYQSLTILVAGRFLADSQLFVGRWSNTVLERFVHGPIWILEDHISQADLTPSYYWFIDYPYIAQALVIWIANCHKEKMVNLLFRLLQEVGSGVLESDSETRLISRNFGKHHWISYERVFSIHFLPFSILHLLVKNRGSKNITLQLFPIKAT